MRSCEHNSNYCLRDRWHNLTLSSDISNRPRLTKKISFRSTECYLRIYIRLVFFLKFHLLFKDCFRVVGVLCVIACYFVSFVTCQCILVLMLAVRCYVYSSLSMQCYCDIDSNVINQYIHTYIQ